MQQLVEDAQYSFRKGETDIAGPTEYQADEVALMQNCRVSFDGSSARRRAGSRRTHVTALDSGSQWYGGIEYRTAAGATQLCAFVGDTFQTSTDGGVTWVSRATGLNQAYWDIVIMRVGASNYLIAANGGTNTVYWDGTTFGNLSNIPNNVTRVAVFNDRLYAAGHSGITVVASAAGDPNTWATASGGLSLPAQTHDGDPTITALYALGNVLLVFKRESFGYIEGYGFYSIQVQVGSRGIARAVGCVAFRSIQAVGGNAICFLSERGLEYYQLGGQPILVSAGLQNLFDNIAWSNVIATPGLPCALYWARNREYWLNVPTSGATQNNQTIIFRPSSEAADAALWHYTYAGDTGGTLYVDSDGDLQYSSNADRSLAFMLGGDLTLAPTGQYVTVDADGDLVLVSIDHVGAVLFTADRTSDSGWPYSGGYDGFLRVLETGDTDDQTLAGAAGDSILMRLRSRVFHYNDPVRRKRARSGRVFARPEAGAATVTFVMIADGEQISTRDLSFAPAVNVDEATTVRARTHARGYNFQVELRTTDDVSIQGLTLGVQPMREAP